MFALSGTNLPSLRSYAAALKHYEGAPEQDSGWRGLQIYDRAGGKSASKRDTSKRIRKNGDGSLDLRYHYTDLVRWYPDNTVSFDFHGSASSQTFTSCFIPFSLRCIRRKDIMYIQQTDGLHLCAGSNLRLIFSEVKPNVWECTNTHAAQLFEGYTVDRKRMAAIQKKLREFTQWVWDVNRLTGNAPVHRFGDVTSAVMVLRNFMADDAPVTVEHFMTLRSAAEVFPSLQFFMRHAYVVGGAVKKETLPLGSLPKESPYEGLLSWRYV